MQNKVNILIFLVAIIISACAPNQLTTITPSSSPVTEQSNETIPPAWLHFGLDTSGINTLDPDLVTTRQERILVDMVFNGLVRNEPGNMPTLEPSLAVELPQPVLKDGKQVWLFQLRRGVMCQPGPLTDAYELTAEDVVYSLQKSADPQRSGYAGEYKGMTFRAVDQYTLSITLDTPLSLYLCYTEFIRGANK